jgi:hypothetical protein
MIIRLTKQFKENKNFLFLFVYYLLKSSTLSFMQHHFQHLITGGNIQYILRFIK